MIELFVKNSYRLLNLFVFLKNFDVGEGLKYTSDKYVSEKRLFPGVLQSNYPETLISSRFRLVTILLKKTMAQGSDVNLAKIFGTFFLNNT